VNTTITPAVAKAAVALRQSHPAAPALDVLDIVMQGHCGCLADFGDETSPATPFGFLLAECFDRGMEPEDWSLVICAGAGLRAIWTDEVLPRFAARYALK